MHGCGDLMAHSRHATPGPAPQPHRCPSAAHGCPSAARSIQIWTASAATGLGTKSLNQADLARRS